MSPDDLKPGDRVTWDWGDPTIPRGKGRYLGVVGHGEAVVQADNRPEGKLLLIPFFMLQASV